MDNVEGLKDVGCTVQTAAEYAWKTGCVGEKSAKQGVLVLLTAMVLMVNLSVRFS